MSTIVMELGIHIERSADGKLTNKRWRTLPVAPSQFKKLRYKPSLPLFPIWHILRICDQNNYSID
jgi:hypothetical protein